MMEPIVSASKKHAAALLAACLLASGSFGSAAAKSASPAVGMPNPMVEYASVRDGEPGKTLTLRTAPAKRQQTKDISGIYGVKWLQRNIDDTTVFMAKVPAESKACHDGYAAYWQQDGMLFSAYAENISEAEFTHLLKDGLLDLSRIYF